ncbi:response regulator transcription factor [Bacillus sp. FJAT-27986]|uniref:response regulator transcription factor n=1 Tax=Bacillus sp. FJAT-27986 TaxID=1743146 RepID=UPI00080AC31F|nr:response regulator transcription factor [Bacillus sp. FJAT-27986]OCA86603.1 hypothetical protein A8L44_04720 [Bacillus sp. FJAT-27986]
MVKDDGICRILIVDDEILIRQGIKHYLDWESEGFQIVGEASNGQEALEMIEVLSPHIIITDIVMPIMNGEELTRVVKEKYPQIEVIILSSYGEFDYVRSAFQCGVVDYILKPKLEAQSLLKVLKTAVKRIPGFQSREKELNVSLSIDQIINRLVLGYDVHFDSKQIIRAFPYSHYSLLGVDLKKHPSKGAAEFLIQVKTKVENVFNKKISEVSYYSFNYDPHIIVFLLNTDQDHMTRVKDVANQLAASQVACGFALTEGFQSFGQLGGILKNSLLKLLNYRFYFPDILVLTERSLPKTVHRSEKFNLDWFTEEFGNKHFDSSFHYLRNHALKLSNCFFVDVFEYKSFISNIIFNITILLGNMNYDIKELEQSRYSFFKLIDEAHSANETIKLLDCFIEEANKCIFLMENRAENITMKKFMDYIKSHYAEPLTLTDVATYFHFNPSYISSYFTTHNHEGFIDSLNRIRIEEACKLLLNETATIAEISEMVGFSEHSYFCKVFKKIKGMSPSQYKRKQFIG